MNSSASPPDHDSPRHRGSPPEHDSPAGHTPADDPAFPSGSTDDLVVTARVARVDRAAVDVLFAGGRARAELGAIAKAGAADPEQLVCVGDFVRIRRVGAQYYVDDVLPRRTAITRATVTPGSSYRQVLAANIDLVAVAEPFDRAPKLSRVERLLALAWESGATPIVVATKVDLAGDFASGWLDQLASAAPGVQVVGTSAAADQVHELSDLLTSGVTAVILGPSGVGKSSLVNALVGRAAMVTQAVRDDHRGRHTTVHRELVELANGALVIDTPGLRSLGLATTDALDQVFADLEELATACRFSDCQHDTEPGCAVQSAIAAGVIDERRLVSWRKLQREAAYQARRTDARLRALEAARWRARSKQHRHRGRP
jgi:ribosome biogenesis GTPase